MNVFILAVVRIFSFGERLIAPFNLAIASLNGTISFLPHGNILTIARIKTSFVKYKYNEFTLEFCCNINATSYISQINISRLINMQHNQ